jgi:hypothetical protein
VELAKIKSRQAEEPVWQLRFPQPVFFVEAHILSRFNKSENAKGMWKSIFASFHTGSEARPTRIAKLESRLRGN